MKSNLPRLISIFLIISFLILLIPSLGKVVIFNNTSVVWLHRIAPQLNDPKIDQLKNEDICHQSNIENIGIENFQNNRFAVISYVICSKNPNLDFIINRYEEGNDFSNLQFIYWQLGRTLYTLGEEDQAISVWRKIENLDIFFSKIAVHFYFDTDEKKDIVMRYLDLSEKINSALSMKKSTAYYAGYLLYRNGPHKNVPLANKYANMLANAQPTPRNLLILGHSYKALGDNYSALKAFNRIIMGNGEELDAAYFEKGRILAAIGQPELAIDSFNHVSEKSIYFNDARINIVDILIELGKKKDAIQLIS